VIFGLSSLPAFPWEDCKEQQQSDNSLFFFVGSEQVLSDVEKRLSVPKFMKLYPSDFWIDFPDDSSGARLKSAR
jgi:hypothetical protein